MIGSRSVDGGDQWTGAGPTQGSDGVARALPSLIHDSELALGEKLGSGSFGVVRKGEWHTPTGRVVRSPSYLNRHLFIKSHIFKNTQAYAGPGVAPQIYTLKAKAESLWRQQEKKSHFPTAASHIRRFANAFCCVTQQITK